MLICQDAQASGDLTEGALVMIQGLRHRTDLNGRMGEVVSWNRARGRYTISVEPLDLQSLGAAPRKMLGQEARPPGCSSVGMRHSGCFNNYRVSRRRRKSHQEFGPGRWTALT